MFSSAALALQTSGEKALSYLFQFLVVVDLPCLVALSLPSLCRGHVASFSLLKKKKGIYSLSMFGWAGSSLMHGLFSSCGQQGLLSSRGDQAPHGVVASFGEHGF